MGTRRSCYRRRICERVAEMATQLIEVRTGHREMPEGETAGAAEERGRQLFELLNSRPRGYGSFLADTDVPIARACTSSTCGSVSARSLAACGTWEPNVATDRGH